MFGMFGMFGMCNGKRTISKIQRDKNQIIFPRDGFECDGRDVGVVEICRVVHYDVLFVLCVKKKKTKKKYNRDKLGGRDNHTYNSHACCSGVIVETLGTVGRCQGRVDETVDAAEEEDLDGRRR